ncbi:ubiquitin-conjugating enzyme E2 N isoform X1 [Saccopteryx bilineata]|uniref:ubiquitin-conjugating enzyme E2 N isoform X1 n=1 Tax=Saccopteryx bilineata TaxID=59482 RepID=UPI00338EB953
MVTFQKWRLFKNGDFDIDTCRSGRPSEFDEELGNARKECHGATVNKELYIAQLHRVNEAIRLKRPDRHGQTILLHDNARPHVAQVVKAALQELEWEVLQHPPYSPDLTPTDYHLFRSLSNHMKGVTFDNKEVLKNWPNNFFDTRPGNFWRNGINKLVERWEEVVNSNGKYIID